jgi:hypothetical protein
MDPKRTFDSLKSKTELPRTEHIDSGIRRSRRGGHEALLVQRYWHSDDYLWLLRVKAK